MIVNSQYKPSWSVSKGLMLLSSLKLAAPNTGLFMLDKIYLDVSAYCHSLNILISCSVNTGLCCGKS